jgi:glycosyltransferase involved in cell wall biosynthesis
MVEDFDGIRTLRVKVPNFARQIPIFRALWQFSLACSFLFLGLLVNRTDVILIYSPPLTLGITAWMLSRLKGGAFILNVQDLFPQSVIDLGILKNRILIQFFEAMERFVYLHAIAITVHSEGNREHVIGKGTKPEKVQVIPNWVDTNFLTPGAKSNNFSQKFGLDNKFVVSFAGVLGYSQDVDVVLEAAHRLRTYPDILFLIVGDGVEKTRLEKKARDLNLDNVRFLPMQPRSIYPQVIQASDISLVTLHDFVKTPVVPSKILSIMAVGRPVVAGMDLAGDAPKLIDQARCGITLPPGDVEGLTEAIVKLYRNRELREELGRNGRRYAEEHLSLTIAGRAYEEMFTRLSAYTPTG